MDPKLLEKSMYMEGQKEIAKRDEKIAELSRQIDDIVNEKKAWELTPRLVRIRSLVFDRQITLLNCTDLETGSDRQFRLDKIKQATVLDPNPS